MYQEKREKGQNPDDWAENLGLHRGYMLGARALFRAWMSQTFHPVWRDVRKRVRRGQSILDAGCGMGQWVRFFARKGLAAAGLDFSSDMISVLQRRFPYDEWVAGTVQSMPFPDSRFDHLISLGVIEHDAEGPGKALAEFCRVIKPGGYCFVTTPIDTDLHRRTQEMQFDQSNPRAVFFQYLFTPEELADYVRKAGFTVETILPHAPSLALVFPRLYITLQQSGRWKRALCERLLQPLVWFRRDCHSMVLVVGRKPV